MRFSELDKGQQMILEARQIFSIQLKPTSDSILNKYPGLYLYYSPDVNFGVLLGSGLM